MSTRTKNFDTLAGQKPVERVLIMHQGALGDFICLLPALASLRQAFPEAHFTVMGYPRICELVKERYYADAVVSADCAQMASLYQEIEQPSFVQEFFGSFQLIGIVGSKPDVTMRNLRTVSAARIVVIPAFPSSENSIHLTAHFMSLPRSCGAPAFQDIPHLKFLESDRRAAAEVFEEHGITPEDPLFAIHPGSGGRGKMWPLKRFCDLAERLRADHRVQTLLILGPCEEEIAESIVRRGCSGFSAVLDSLPLPHLGAIIERCRLFIGNDSGISHMAASVGIPVVAIFGPTDPVQWAPMGPGVRVVRRVMPCSPCQKTVMNRCKSRRCLCDISTEEVLSVIQESLGWHTAPLRSAEHFGGFAEAEIGLSAGDR